MIKANHKKWAESIFYPFINRLMKKNFSHFYLVNEFPQGSDLDGLILTPNHISWWDGFFIGIVLKKYSNRKPFIMMLEEQLNKFWFFKKVGAFSINPNSAKGILESAGYIAQIVSDTKNCAILFPQGEIEPFEKRPLTIKKGLKILTSKVEKEFYVLPVGFKIQYYNEKYPAVIVRFGNLLDGNNVLKDYSFFENEFMDNLQKLNEASYNEIFTHDLLGKK
jgi:1-acyl-sn-glycerol-3-phosphate acyltransferase